MELIRAASDFRFLPPPHLRGERIEHEDPRLHIRTRQQDVDGDITIARDLTIGGNATGVSLHEQPGGPCFNALARGARWREG